MKKKSEKPKEKEYIVHVKDVDGTIYFVGEIISDYLDDLLFEMEEEISPLAFSRTLSKEQSKNSLIDASMNLQGDVRKVLDIFQDENLEKEESCPQIMIDSLMWLYGRFEKVTNSFDISKIDGDKNPVWRNVGEIVISGQNLVGEMLLNFFNISTFTFAFKDKINEKYQNFIKSSGIKEDEEIETRTMHQGFIDNDTNEILQKEMVAVYRKPTTEKKREL